MNRNRKEQGRERVETQNEQKQRNLQNRQRIETLKDYKQTKNRIR